MGRRKKGGDATAIVALMALGGVIWIVQAIPKEMWWVLGALGLVALVMWIAEKSKSSKPAPPPSTRSPSGARRTTSRPGGVSVELRVGDSDAVEVRSGYVFPKEYLVPPRPGSLEPGRWVPAGEAVTVQGIRIPGGLLYVGGVLPPKNVAEPCLIDPTLPVGSTPDNTDTKLGYWPSYDRILPDNRRAYLEWLAEGRLGTGIPIGYVFLFYYGMERRVLVDAKTDPAAVAELPCIRAEVARLRELYGPQSRSFQRYSTAFLDWIDVLLAPNDLYQRRLPTFTRGKEIPALLRLALARASKDGAALSPELALAWVRTSPAVAERGAMKAAPGPFATTFERRYREAFGDGMVVPPNRTKLCVEYRPASGGFSGQVMEHKFSDLPDVTVVTGPINKLIRLVEACNADLGQYASAGGRARSGEDGWSLAFLTGMSVSLWPAKNREAVAALRQRVAGSVAVMSCEELHTALGSDKVLAREKMQVLARRLEAEGLGMEPDVQHGARTPKASEPVVLFALDASDQESRNNPAYQAAQLMLQLSSAVAAADGHFGPEEMRHLAAQVKSWSLTPGQQKRLMAHLRLLVAAPMSLSGMKKKLDPLPAEAKEAIAEFMVATAHADGTISPEEVKVLEKAYRALSIDAKRVFSDLHGMESSTPPAPTAPIPGAAVQPTAPGGMVLDHAKVAALQRDTARVSALLSTIFTEEPPATPAEDVEVEGGVPEEAAAPALLGLDEKHAAFVRALLVRPHWSREEANDVAADLELMLDGALERVNEASFDAFDLPLTEGDDPLEVNQEVLERIEA